MKDGLVETKKQKNVDGSQTNAMNNVKDGLKSGEMLATGIL